MLGQWLHKGYGEGGVSADAIILKRDLNFCDTVRTEELRLVLDLAWVSRMRLPSVENASSGKGGDVGVNGRWATSRGIKNSPIA